MHLNEEEAALHPVDEAVLSPGDAADLEPVAGAVSSPGAAADFPPVDAVVLCLVDVVALLAADVEEEARGAAEKRGPQEK
jgi:hypothetical protein